MKRVVASSIALALAGVVGCGGPKVVSVSGVVKLDGKPYKNAVVSFQPLGDRDNPNPGRGSSAVTDENGRYRMIYDGENPGALVGKHRVRIFTQFGADPDPEFKGESPRPPLIGGPKFVEPIPPDWNEMSTREFEVPAGGTDKADFDISTKKGG